VIHVVVISPHPDDCEYGISGVLAAGIAESGWSATIATYTGAPELGAPSFLPGQAALRDDECREAAELLGASALPLAASLETPRSGALTELVTLLRVEQPDLVITVDPNDAHPFHRRVASWVAEAVFLSAVATAEAADTRPLLQPPQLLYMEAFSSIAFAPDVYVDVTPWFAPARRALLAHRTGLQVTPGLEYQMRASHMRHGAAAGVELAEGLRLTHGYAQDWAGPRMRILGALADLHQVRTEVAVGARG
jgi:LmbE family N-acetylglucosaminyl deacetylase